MGSKTMVASAGVTGRADAEALLAVARQLRAEVGKRIIGQEQVV